MALKGMFFLLIAFLSVNVRARPFKSPDFVSQWFYLTSIPGKERVNVSHYLGEIPAVVQVQVRSDTNNNNGFIFPAIGIVPRDDDSSDPRSGVVYLYNEKMVTVSALSENNHVRGRIIYTENSAYWEGPNNDEAYSCYIRVRAWKKSSFPIPDYHLERVEIQAGCAEGTDCFYERYHGLKEYPGMVVVRTKLVGPEEPFHGYMSDAVGSGLMIYENLEYNQNGYVIYGFDNDNFRIWTDTSTRSFLFYGHDGSGLKTSFKSGELEILAWKSSSLTPNVEITVQLGTIPGGEFDKESSLNSLSRTEDILLNLWAEATDGANSGYRFAGSGSLAYTTVPTTYPCSYGGLTYAYTNASIRLWKPGPANIGNIICIPRTFGGGIHTQGSNMAQAKVHVWIPQVSTLHQNCSDNEACFDLHSVCKHSTCMCKDGYYDSDGICEKDLTCADFVPFIPSLEKRARNYVIEPNSNFDTYVNDKLLKLSWYTATLNNNNYMMLDLSAVPDKNACGSKHQIYINGTHPPEDKINETPVTLNVCFNECKQEEKVLVRKCAGSLQYRLKPLPIQDIAYCFDPPELLGIQEFDPPPQVEEFTINLSVELHFHQFYKGNVISFDPYLTFNCSLEKNISKQLFLTSYWFLGSDLFLALGPSRNVQNLTEKMMIDRKQGLDVHMSCGIRISESKSGLMSPLIKSSEKFFGIKVHNPVVVLKKGENGFVTIEPTAPIGLRYAENQPSLTHPLVMVQKETEGCDLSDIIKVDHTSKCGSNFKAYTFNETWFGGDVYHFEITTKDKNYADRHQFRLHLVLNDHIHRIWNNKKIKDIMVYVTHNDDSKFKLCYSHIDPHMQTADGYKFENQYKGEFILYRNVKYGIEVQEKTTICNQGRAYCACAVAIRAGGDVFVINTCGGLKFIGFTSCSDGGILDVRNRTSLRYQVFTPIGTYIDIQMRPHPNYYNLMNIDIYLAPKDIDRTEGLCGYFDNNKSNDLRKRNKDTITLQNNRRNYHPDFSQEWRRKPFEENYLLLNPAVVLTWQAEQRDMYCYCNQTRIQDDGATTTTTSTTTTDASVPEAVAVCSASIYGECHQSEKFVTKQLCEATFQRGRRSTSFARKRELERRQQLIYKQSKFLKKREASSNVTITEEQATRICSDLITSQQSVKDFHHRLKSLDVNQVIAECAFDVSEGNDLTWADVYPSVLNQVIETNNEHDPEYVEANKDEVERFNLQSCPFNCNDNGNCSIEGECQCDSGFYGPDCSINEESVVNIDDIESDGLCDLKFGDECRCFHIQTINLLQHFQCQISETLVMMNGSESSIYTTQHTGQYIDIFNGECCLSISPPKRSETSLNIFRTEYDVSISNNGKIFGNTVKVYLFDSTCQVLNSSDNGTYFELKENTCFISGLCRIQNESSSGDECSVCFPQHNKFDWTGICDSSGIPTAETGQTLGLVLGLSAGLFITVTLIIVFCLFRHFFGGKKEMFTVAEMTIYKLKPPKVMEHRYRQTREKSELSI